METAVLVVKTLKILCPQCGTEVGPPVAGVAEWTPAVALTVTLTQEQPDYYYGEHAPMCSGCGAFLRIDLRDTEATLHWERPEWVPVPKVEA